jgi:hypothetical protein|tara:strand:- start:42 stop:635 length:594 start_codon:yes stop_codon:yes gene_type:complete
MAHSPIVGTGISFAATVTSGMTTSFAIKTPYLRITPRGAGAHVAFSQTARTVTADAGSYYIPDGTSETLAMSRYSQKVVGITIGASTVLTCPEGQTMPFNVGNVVQLVCPITSSNGDIVNQYNFVALVSAIDNSQGPDGDFQTKVTVDAITTGVSTAWTASNGRADTVLYSAGRLAARTDGAAGNINIIQVQTTGDA